MKRNNIICRGFTIIELLIVISVLGLLIGTVAMNLPSQGRNARDNRRRVDIEQIRASLELYRTDQVNGNYPATLPELSPIYLTTIPTDPLNPATPYTYAPRDPLGAACSTGGPPGAPFCTTYQISTVLEVDGPYSLGPQDIAQ